MTPPASGNDLQMLRDRLRRFALDREWDQFHSPKNLAAALSVEAAELLEHFQWISEDDSKQLTSEQLEKVGDEMADVLWVLICLANQTGINLTEAFHKNLEKKNKRDADRHQTNEKLK